MFCCYFSSRTLLLRVCPLHPPGQLQARRAGPAPSSSACAGGGLLLITQAVSRVGSPPPPAAVTPLPLWHRDPVGLSAPGCPGPVPCRTLCPSGGFVHGGAQRGSVQPPVRQCPCRPPRGFLGNQVSCRQEGGARLVGARPALPQDAPRAAREDPRPVGLRRPGVGTLGATGRGAPGAPGVGSRGGQRVGRAWSRVVRRGQGAGPAREGRARRVGSAWHRAPSAQPGMG